MIRTYKTIYYVGIAPDPDTEYIKNRCVHTFKGEDFLNYISQTDYYNPRTGEIKDIKIYIKKFLQEEYKKTGFPKAQKECYELFEKYNHSPFQYTRDIHLYQKNYKKENEKK